MKTIEARDLCVVTESVPVEIDDPRPFLRLSREEPRGFWAQGSRWVAHFGAAARIQVVSPSSQPGHSSPPGRFQRVWEEATRVLPQEDEAGTPYRFFGGFSFRSDHRPAGFWREFPNAFFLLPEVELVSKPGSSVLRARAILDEPDEEDRVRERLLGRLEEIAATLSSSFESEPPVSHHSSRTETDRTLWEDTVRKALRSIENGDVSKVVLARTLEVRIPDLVDPAEMVLNLWHGNQGTHVFLFEPVPGEVLLGAAPETVVTLKGDQLRATAVAGSISRGDSPEEQETLAQKLLESEKDRVEHEIALRDMVERLEPLAETVTAAPGPHVLTLSGIQHLETEITAKVNSDQHVLSLLETLHPTPAVCGLPRDGALEFLQHEEPFERGWYAGPVGWFDTRGDGVFVPALRSAVASGTTWRLFAGAGIVEGSEPALEWEETRIKFGPVLRALEASGVVSS